MCFLPAYSVPLSALNLVLLLTLRVPRRLFSVLDEDKREVGVVFDAGNPAFGDPRNKRKANRAHQ
jgi:hypothetical protein